MIDYDISGSLPTGALGWTRLLEAIERAQPTDETEWVEFKAGIDPSKPAGRAHIARAIVAFANRDPQRATQWLGGHGLVIVGLEPGNNQGCRQIDPVQVYDGIQPLLKAPAPDWDHAYHLYDGKHVLVVTVVPPRQGDPIACIGKSSEGVNDGNVFVRFPGKSAPPTSDDIRRLSVRLQPTSSLPTLGVRATTDGEVRRCEWPTEWIAPWLTAERTRLLTPMETATAEKAAERDKMTNLGLHPDIYGVASARRTVSDALALSTDPEDRSPEQYREQVDAYIARCERGVANCEPRIAAGVVPETTFHVTNSTDDNLEKVEVVLHVEGEVEAYEPLERVEVRDGCPKPPRTWGPRPKAAMYNLMQSISQVSPPYIPGPFAPSPIIENGGSATITFPTLHLRPGETAELDGTIALVVFPEFEGEALRCTWEATATNVSGVMSGSFEVPLGSMPLDLSPEFENEPPQSRVIRPN